MHKCITQLAPVVRSVHVPEIKTDRSYFMRGGAACQKIWLQREGAANKYGLYGEVGGGGGTPK